jgi:hypothetical protein
VTTVRPIKVRVGRISGGWFAQVDQVDDGVGGRSRLRGWEFASGHEEEEEEEGGRIEWFLDLEIDLPPDVTRPELEEALSAECERLAKHGYTDTTELDRHIRQGRIRACDN